MRLELGAGVGTRNIRRGTFRAMGLEEISWRVDMPEKEKRPQG